MNNQRKRHAGPAAFGPTRKEPLPAEYKDEISEEEMERLRKLACSDLDEDEEVEVIDGPAW